MVCDVCDVLINIALAVFLFSSFSSSVFYFFVCAYTAMCPAFYYKNDVVFVVFVVVVSGVLYFS